jgi:hypothetical protein
MAKPKQSAARPQGAAAGSGPVRTGPAKAGAANGGPAKDTPAKTGPAKGAPAKAGPAQSAPAKGAPARAAGGGGAGKRGAGGAGAKPLAAVAAPVALPQSLRIAVWLMYAGAALAALDLIATLATIGSARGELHRANPHWTAAELTTGVHSFIFGIVVSWAITIAVWLIMARTNQAGRGWARNVATVLSALSTLSFILYLHEPGSLLGKLLLVPMWLVGVAAATLLWRRESTAYIRAGVL